MERHLVANRNWIKVLHYHPSSKRGHYWSAVGGELVAPFYGPHGLGRAGWPAHQCVPTPKCVLMPRGSSLDHKLANTGMDRSFDSFAKKMTAVSDTEDDKKKPVRALFGGKKTNWSQHSLGPQGSLLFTWCLPFCTPASRWPHTNPWCGRLSQKRRRIYRCHVGWLWINGKPDLLLNAVSPHWLWSHCDSLPSWEKRAK